MHPGQACLGLLQRRIAPAAAHLRERALVFVAAQCLHFGALAQAQGGQVLARLPAPGLAQFGRVYAGDAHALHRLAAAAHGERITIPDRHDQAEGDGGSQHEF